MTQQLHQQANALLYKALERPVQSRREFIAQACGARRDLFDLVGSMLSHIDQLDAFLEQPLATPTVEAASAGSAPSGAQIGPWRVVRELQRGALGSILLVECSDGAERQIAALKIVDASALSLEDLALFHRQRQRLATLAHPAIARLLDGGSLADGRPYFVMEYSDGVPIDEYCAEAHLSRRERIDLFIQVCRAVHHAHQRLVVHRHLHTSNILVGRDGTLKLADFGVADLLEQDSQAGTGADLLALGVVLGALLGAAPAIALRGDLGRILELAGRSGLEPGYPSADELARDLQRCLDDVPIMALPSRAGARLRQLVRRRPLVTVLACTALAVMGATAVLGADQLAHDQDLQRGLRRTLASMEARVDSALGARTAAKRRVTEVATLKAAAPAQDPAELTRRRDAAAAIAELPAAIAAWAALQHDAENMLRQQSSNGAATEVLADALGHLAALRRVTGDFDGARQSALQWTALAAQQAKAAPADARWRAQQADSAQESGAIAIERGEFADALAQLRTSLALREDMAGEDAEPGAQRDIAHARIALADALVATKDYAGAETEYKLARDAFAASPDDAAARVQRDRIDLARATGQYLRRHGKSAGQLVRALRSGFGPATSEAMRARAALLEALIQPGGTAGQAYAAAQQALPALLKETESDATDSVAQRESAMAWRSTGEIGLRAGQKESACGYLNLAEKRYDELAQAKRLGAVDVEARAQLATLRAGCE